jgi:hypothetical protein
MLYENVTNLMRKEIEADYENKLRAAILRAGDIGVINLNEKIKSSSSLASDSTGKESYLGRFSWRTHSLNKRHAGPSKIGKCLIGESSPNVADVNQIVTSVSA